MRRIILNICCLLLSGPWACQTQQSNLYRVQAGDTLSKISNKFNVSLRFLISRNKLRNPHALYIGQPIYISGEPAYQKKRIFSQKRAIWPLHGKVTSEFGWRQGGMHYGLDIGARHGKSIYASAAGRVSFVGWKTGYGKTIVIDHGAYETLYAHCGEILMQVGRTVRGGQTIAKVGDTGNARGAHLHFEYRLSGQAKNPRELFEKSVM